MKKRAIIYTEDGQQIFRWDDNNASANQNLERFFADFLHNFSQKKGMLNSVTVAHMIEVLAGKINPFRAAYSIVKNPDDWRFKKVRQGIDKVEETQTVIENSPAHLSYTE